MHPSVSLRREFPIAALLAASAVLFAGGARAQPAFRVEKAYEDSVRILLLSNLEAVGKCEGPTGPVGERTRDFVLRSLSGIAHVASLPAEGATWATVEAAWPGRLPHVIVHVNAGWKSRSGPALDSILDRAAGAAIGVVSIGDDAAAFADRTFGFHDVENVPEPMGDARRFTGPDADLWIDLDGPGDTTAAGGIVRNTVRIFGTRRLRFLPVEPDSADPAGRYRCQADADKYAVDPAFAGRVAFLGFQRAFDGQDTVGGPRELQVIAAFQDRIRRGVALSYQPQFLADSLAAHQIDYDAVIFASYAHAIGKRDTVPVPPVPPPRVEPPPQADPPARPDTLHSVRAFPPVAGDRRPAAWAGLGAAPVPTWIPPVGFVPGTSYRDYGGHSLPAPGQVSQGQDLSSPVPVPDGVGLVRVLGGGRYLARVAIFDHLGQPVRRFTQSFGYRGELDNPHRITPSGLRSYLVWDLRDDRGAPAGQGVYIWKLELVLESGARHRRTLRTGLLRQAAPVGAMPSP